jgi:hypothetical protein
MFVKIVTEQAVQNIFLKLIDTQTFNTVATLTVKDNAEATFLVLVNNLEFLEILSRCVNGHELNALLLEVL